MKTRIICLFIFSVLQIKGFSQLQDSVEQIRKSNDDTVKVNALVQLADSFHHEHNSEKALQLANEAKTLSEKLDFLKGQYQANKILSRVYYSNVADKQMSLANKRMLEVAELMDDPLLILDAKLNLAWGYDNTGYTFQAIQLYDQVLAMALELKNEPLITRAHNGAGLAYIHVGDYRIAKSHFRHALKLYKKINDHEKILSIYIYLGDLMQKQQLYDSALIYFGKATTVLNDNHLNRADYYKSIILAQTARSLFSIGNHKVALAYYEDALQFLQNDPFGKTYYFFSLVGVGEIHVLNKNYLRAIDPLERAIKYYENIQYYCPPLIRGYDNLIQAYTSLGDYKRANKLSRDFSVAKDSLNARQKKEKLNELMVKYQVKENENQIKQLQRESTTSNLILGLLIGAFVLSMFIVLLFISRQKLRYTNENKELELTVLRSQMNPHFIFNCLNSISRFITKSQVVAATNYLSKFAKLIRSILDNSKHTLVPLDQEISTLILYLELETMRFSNKFTYTINVQEELDTETLKITPMIIQPFIENAIWHGLQHKNEPGNISILFSIQNKFLVCTIEDNGVGRQNATDYEKKSEQFSISQSKSYGIQITKDRLLLLSKKGLRSSLRILDLFDSNNNPSGTKVQISIPIMN